MIEPLVFGLVATWTRQSRPENIAALIESDPLLLRIPNSQGNLLLHALVKGRDNDSRRVAPYIIAHVAEQDPNALRVKNRSGFLPIHLAKESINKKLLVLLLEKMSFCCEASAACPVCRRRTVLAHRCRTLQKRCDEPCPAIVSTELQATSIKCRSS